MKSQLMFAAAAAFALAAVSPSAAEAQCVGSPLADNSGIPITGCGNDLVIPGDFSVTYVGSSAAYWHSLWVFTTDQITGTPQAPASPFNPATDGTLITCKFTDCTLNGSPAPAHANDVDVSWGGGTAVFGLYVIPNMTGSGSYPASGYNGEGYWLFSGDASRNPDNMAHAAYFSDKLLDDDRTSTLANVGTNDFLLGFEDMCAEFLYDANGKMTCSGAFGGTDWDFNDAAFAFAVPDDTTEVVPEPATMTLLATGLVGMAAARRRRNNKK